VSYGKFPTYSLRPITDSSVAQATSAPRSGATFPDGPDGRAGGFRLVARHTSGGASQEEARYAHRRHSTRQDPTKYYITGQLQPLVSYRQMVMLTARPEKSFG